MKEGSVQSKKISLKIHKVHSIKMKLTLLFSVRKHHQETKDLVKQLLALSNLPETSASWLVSTVN